jgi:hypothetical protein
VSDSVVMGLNVRAGHHECPAEGCVHLVRNTDVFCVNCQWKLPRVMRQAVSGAARFADRHYVRWWNSLTFLEACADAVDYLAAHVVTKNKVLVKLADDAETDAYVENIFRRHQGELLEQHAKYSNE